MIPRYIPSVTMTELAYLISQSSENIGLPCQPSFSGSDRSFVSISEQLTSPVIAELNSYIRDRSHMIMCLDPLLE